MARPGKSIRFTRREWRNVALFAIAVMALTTLPYLAGAAAQRPDWHFGWFLFGIVDGNSYLAKMRQGAVDGWLFHIVYTSEPHEGAVLFTPYLAGGKLIALFVSPSSPAFVDAMLVVFHTSRIVFGMLLILVTYRFIAAFLAKRSLRWLALILVCLGGGFGWLLTVLGLGYWLNSLPVDMYLPEGYTFYLLYGLPHLALARAALLGGLMLIFHALTLDSPRRWLPWALSAGLCWLLVGLCVPFYIAVLYAILGVWGLASLIRHRRFPARLFWRCIVGAIIPAPLLAYNLYVFATNPIMGAWSSQNVLPSPHPLHYVFGYGLLAILAIPAIRWAWRRGRRKVAYLLIPAWVVAGPVLAYLPVTVQRRLLEGIFVPLCILAVMGLRLWWVGATRRFRRWLRLSWRLAALTVLALTLPTTLLLLLSGVGAVQWYDPANHLFHTSVEIAALDWLNTHVPADSVVLSDFDTGNTIPARASLRVFIGHSPETICLDMLPGSTCTVSKRELVSRLFAGQMSADERRSLFSAYGIRYIIFPQGRADVNSPDLSLIYDDNDYHIYEVNR
jgi:hypothetical protein